MKCCKYHLVNVSANHQRCKFMVACGGELTALGSIEGTSTCSYLAGLNTNTICEMPGVV